MNFPIVALLLAYLTILSVTMASPMFTAATSRRSILGLTPSNAGYPHLGYYNPYGSVNTNDQQKTSADWLAEFQTQFKNSKPVGFAATTDGSASAAYSKLLATSNGLVGPFLYATKPEKSTIESVENLEEDYVIEGFESEIEELESENDEDDSSTTDQEDTADATDEYIAATDSLDDQLVELEEEMKEDQMPNNQVNAEPDFTDGPAVNEEVGPYDSNILYKNADDTNANSEQLVVFEEETKDDHMMSTLDSNAEANSIEDSSIGEPTVIEGVDPSDPDFSNGKVNYESEDDSEDSQYLPYQQPPRKVLQGPQFKLGQWWRKRHGCLSCMSITNAGEHNKVAITFNTEEMLKHTNTAWFKMRKQWSKLTKGIQSSSGDPKYFKIAIHQVGRFKSVPFITQQIPDSFSAESVKESFGPLDLGVLYEIVVYVSWDDLPKPQTIVDLGIVPKAWLDMPYDSVVRGSSKMYVPPNPEPLLFVSMSKQSWIRLFTTRFRLIADEDSTE